jgi:hypothetical protein
MKKKNNRWFSLLLLLLFCNCWSQASPSKQSAQASERARDESNAVRRRAQNLGCNSSERRTQQRLPPCHPGCEGGGPGWGAGAGRAGPAGVGVKRFYVGCN